MAMAKAKYHIEKKGKRKSKRVISRALQLPLYCFCALWVKSDRPYALYSPIPISKRAAIPGFPFPYEPPPAESRSLFILIPHSRHYILFDIFSLLVVVAGVVLASRLAFASSNPQRQCTSN